MAKLETVVRPVVFPNIRPARLREAIPEDDPTKDVHVIQGSSGGFIDLPYDYTHQITRQVQTEIKRKVDVVRVYQKEEDGTVNRENFIDVEVTNKLWMKESGEGGSTPTNGPGGVPETGSGKPGGKSADLEVPAFYSKPEKSDNVEIRKEDIIVINKRYWVSTKGGG